MQYIE